MNKGKRTAVAVVTIALAGAMAVFAVGGNLLAAGDYYVKVDHAQMTENDSRGGVVNFKGDEPFLYTLPAWNALGEQRDVTFDASHELRDGAYLKLRLEPVRGVVAWEEVQPDELPGNVAEAIGGI